MANNLTSTEYNAIKNKEVSVVSFENGKRTLTYSGLNYKEAVEHCIEKQSKGEICLIIPIGNFGMIEQEVTNDEDTLQGHLNYLQEERKKQQEKEASEEADRTARHPIGCDCSACSMEPDWSVPEFDRRPKFCVECGNELPSYRKSFEKCERCALTYLPIGGF